MSDHEWPELVVEGCCSCFLRGSLLGVGGILAVRPLTSKGPGAIDFILCSRGALDVIGLTGAYIGSASAYANGLVADRSLDGGLELGPPLDGDLAGPSRDGGLELGPSLDGGFDEGKAGKGESRLVNSGEGGWSGECIGGCIRNGDLCPSTGVRGDELLALSGVIMPPDCKNGRSLYVSQCC